MSITKRVAKNTLALFGSQVSTTLFRLVFFIYAARFLGPGGLGVYALVLTLVTFFLLIADLGINTLITRDVARDKNKAKEYLSKCLPLIILASLLAYLLLLALTKALGYSADKNILVAIGGIFIFTETLVRFFDAPLKAFERMEIGAAMNSLYGFMSSGLGILVLYLGYGLKGVFWTIVGSSILTASLLLLIVRKYFVKFTIQFDTKFWIKVLKQSLAYGLLGAIGFIYFKVDTVMLSKLKGDEVVGWYNASYKILENLLLVPHSFVLALFPVMSLFHVTSREQLRSTYERASKYLFVVGLPLAVILNIFASPLILIIFGKNYTPSILALQILAWAVLLVFLNSPNIHLLASGDHQYILLAWFSSFVIINIVLNFLLIPKYSLFGASIATLISETLAFVIYYFLIRRYLSGVKLFSHWLKPITAAFAMAVLCLFFFQINILLAFFLGIATYCAIIILLKTFNAEEYQQVLAIIKRKAQSAQNDNLSGL